MSVSEEGQDEATLDSQEEETSGHAIRLYKRRWIMLFIFSALSLTNSLNWIAFAPIAGEIMQHYQVRGNEWSVAGGDVFTLCRWGQWLSMDSP